jgi:hypothetical protein
MTRVVYLFFIAVHVIPFLVVGWMNGDPVPLAVAVALMGLFSVGLGVASFLGQRSSSRVPGCELRCLMPHSALRWIVLAYLAIRSNEIVAILESLLNGTFAERALTLALERYETGGESSALYNVGTIAFLVFCGVVGAEIGAGRRSSRTARAIVVFVMSFAVFVESAALARAGVLMGATLVAAFYLFNRRSALSAMPWRTVCVAYAVVAAAGTALFLFSAYFRLSNADVIGDVLGEKASIYTLAGYEAFARWLQQPPGDVKPFGYYTFASVYKLIGMSVPQGFYESVSTTFGDTNIFFVWRGLVADLGIIGGALSVAVLGYVVARTDTVVIEATGGWVGILSLIFVLYPIISPFIFSTFSAAFVVLFGIGRMGREASDGRSGVECCAFRS